MAYALAFVHRKRITEYCSLRHTLNGNVAAFNVDKWRHTDVIVIKLTAGTQHKIPYKTYIWIFHTWKITKIMLFCNLFMERPSYILLLPESNSAYCDRCYSSIVCPSVTLMHPAKAVGRNEMPLVVPSNTRYLPQEGEILGSEPRDH